MINVEVLVESSQWKKLLKIPKKINFENLKKFPNNYKFINKKVYFSTSN